MTVLISQILNQRKEAELFTPVPFDCWWGGWALKKTKHERQVEENQVGKPRKGLERRNEGPGKGGTYVMGTKDKKDLQGGGQRGNRNQEGNACTSDGPFRTVPLKDQSSGVG